MSGTPQGVAAIFGARLRQTRQARGWTQEDLAAKVGFTGKYVSEIERGLRDVPMSTAARLADGLGSHLSALVQPAGGGSPAALQPADTRTVRTMLGGEDLPAELRRLIEKLAALAPLQQARMVHLLACGFGLLDAKPSRPRRRSR